MKIKITYDELLEKIPNKYELAIASGKRYGQLVKGATPLVQYEKGDTLVQVANLEILMGEVIIERK